MVGPDDDEAENEHTVYLDDDGYIHDDGPSDGSGGNDYSWGENGC
jgi:hypothetical protein